MQTMQDKDFDDLFRDRLTEAEVVPSTDLWAGISDKLEPKRRKFSLIYWSAAAVVLLGVGIAFLYRPDEPARLTAANTKVTKPAGPVVEQPITNRPVAPEQKTEVETVGPVPETNKAEVKAPARASQETPRHEQPAVQPVRSTQPETMIAAAEPVKQVPAESKLEQLRTETAIASVQPEVERNNGFHTQPAFPETDQDETDRRERSGRRDKGILAFVGKVKEKFDKTTRNIITEKNGTVSIDLGFVRIDKETN